VRQEDVPDRRRNSSGSERIYFYYRCPKRRIDGPTACPNSKTQRAERAEEAVWKVVCALLTDLERLRRGLEELIEREREAGGSEGDPERQAELWASRLDRIERKRANFKDMAAEGLINFEELRAKLGALQSEHEQARSELDAVLRRKEKIATLERDAEELLETYAEAVPERLRELGPDERRRVYVLLRAKARCDGGLEVSGVLGAALGDSSPCVSTSQFHIGEHSRAHGPKARVACSIRESGPSHT
jgi:hypothetical protein